jgi:sodium transport system permease protein
MKRLVAVVFRKEMKDHLRDRRSLMSALAMPIFGALVVLVLFTVVASWSRAGKPLLVPVVGREHAPSLVAFLQRNGATLTEAPPDYEALVQAGKLDAVLVIPPDYGKDFSAGHTAHVQMVLDNSRNEARVSNRRLHGLLEGYSSLVASQRLFARGVAPELFTPVRVDEVDLSTPERMAANLLAIIPLFLVLNAFVGGMNVAIDAMAGERERGSLEPLLINPVHRGALVLGKWLATVALACIAVFVCMAAFLLVLKRVPLQDLGVKVRFDAGAVLGMLVAVIPLTFFASAGQMLVSTYARSFKEAQTYLQVLLLLPMLPGMLLSFSPIGAKTCEVMRGQAIGVLPYVLAAAGCIAAAAVCLAFTARLLTQERIVFGRS